MFVFLLSHINFFITFQDLNALAKEHKSVHVVKFDVESDEDISEAVKLIEKTVGDKGLNALINNAAILTVTDFSRITLFDIINLQESGADYKNPDRKIMDRHMSVNVVSPLMITSVSFCSDIC